MGVWASEVGVGDSSVVCFGAFGFDLANDLNMLDTSRFICGGLAVPDFTVAGFGFCSSSGVALEEVESDASLMEVEVASVVVEVVLPDSCLIDVLDVNFAGSLAVVGATGGGGLRVVLRYIAVSSSLKVLSAYQEQTLT